MVRKHLRFCCWCLGCIYEKRRQQSYKNMPVLQQCIQYLCQGHTGTGSRQSGSYLQQGTDHTDNYIQQQGRYCSTSVHCFSRHTGRNRGGEGVGNHHFENHYSCCDGVIQLCNNYSRESQYQ